MTRIVQAANFVGPASGGIRTALDALGCGYLAAGHERVLVVPQAIQKAGPRRPPAVFEQHAVKCQWSC
jgi:hypothetical protein